MSGGPWLSNLKLTLSQLIRCLDLLGVASVGLSFVISRGPRFSFPVSDLDNITNFYWHNRPPVDVNILLRVRPRSQSTDRIINVKRLVTRSRRNCFWTKLATGTDYSAQDREILGASHTNTLSIQSEFEGDHRQPNRK